METACRGLFYPGVSLKAFPGLESIHPDNFHFRHSRLPDSGSALSGLRSAFSPHNKCHAVFFFRHVKTDDSLFFVRGFEQNSPVISGKAHTKKVA
ncbi:Uncharacterised protein [Salmonella enterica subsp. enterica]|uniref:Uncharacterized protein n=1 Tax=Salmonella enterica I TaxID=59201 RepID=A0A3S4IDS6_SALET|nr:Uncharacterised protein [Salmonella enterica subsp. enterica]